VMGSDYKIVVAKFENTNKILADEWLHKRIPEIWVREVFGDSAGSG
jgi:hypothetical protein